jgi:uncharacterized protein (DUF4415 family)
MSSSRPGAASRRSALPRPRQSVHLRLEPEVVDFFKDGGKGHITRMQAVLRAYVDVHKRRRKASRD